MFKIKKKQQIYSFHEINQKYSEPLIYTYNIKSGRIGMTSKMLYAGKEIRSNSEAFHKGKENKMGIPNNLKKATEIIEEHYNNYKPKNTIPNNAEGFIPRGTKLKCWTKNNVFHREDGPAIENIGPATYFGTLKLFISLFSIRLLKSKGLYFYHGYQAENEKQFYDKEWRKIIKSKVFL